MEDVFGTVDEVVLTTGIVVEVEEVMIGVLLVVVIIIDSGVLVETFVLLFT